VSHSEKKGVHAVSADTPIKIALEARARPVKCNGVFSVSQGKSRKAEKMVEKLKLVEENWMCETLFNV
jgi:hypothetical protein